MSKLANQNDPKIDWGFHAVIPRLVRTEYKKITPPQKWAYVCLKDLCGESGTCYRTIRVLAEEIGLSAGMTSETIRVLHDEGLIHAEKKKRHTGGKEVWHITIVDIWAKNGQMHPTKRSPAEQECSPNEQTTRQRNVRTTNVHLLNKKSPVCSPAEQECSPAETEEESLSRINIEAGSKSTYSPRESQSSDFVAHATTPAPNQSLSDDFLAKEHAPTQSKPSASTEHEDEFQSQLSTTSGDKPALARAKVAPKAEKTLTESKPKAPRQSSKPVPPEFTPEGQKVYDAWSSLFKSPPRAAEKTILCANALYPLLVPWCKELNMKCAALLDDIQKQMYATDTNGFYKRGITLCDIERDFEKWQSAKTREAAQPKAEKSPLRKLIDRKRLVLEEIEEDEETA